MPTVHRQIPNKFSYSGHFHTIQSACALLVNDLLLLLTESGGCRDRIGRIKHMTLLGRWSSWSTLEDHTWRITCQFLKNPPSFSQRIRCGVDTTTWRYSVGEHRAHTHTHTHTRLHTHRCKFMRTHMRAHACYHKYTQAHLHTCI